MMKLTKLKRHHSSSGGRRERHPYGGNQSRSNNSNSSSLLGEIGGGGGNGGGGSTSTNNVVLNVDNANVVVASTTSSHQNKTNIMTIVTSNKEETHCRSDILNNDDDDDIESNPIHNNNYKNTSNTSSPFHILKKRLSRNKSKSHSESTNNHHSSFVVLPPLEPPAATTITKVGRSSISDEPTYVVSTLPGEQRTRTMEQIHMEAKIKAVKESLLSTKTLESATTYIQTLPVFTIDEIQLAESTTTSIITKGNYTNIINELVLNNNNNNNNNMKNNNYKQREVFVVKHLQTTTEKEVLLSKPQYSIKRLGSSSSSCTSTSTSSFAAVKELYNEIYILSLLGGDVDNDNEQHLNNVLKLKGLIIKEGHNKEVDEQDYSTPIYTGLIVDTVIQETLEETLNGGRWFVRNKELHYHNHNPITFMKDIMNHSNHNSHHEEKKKFLTERLQYCIDLVSALQYIHSKHIVHTNIQPCNIAFDIQGNIKLINFEHARCVVIEDSSTTTTTKQQQQEEEEEKKEKETITRVVKSINEGSTTTTSSDHYDPSIAENITCETLKYIAPELLLLNSNNNNNVTKKAVDIYSMGYILWQIIGLKHRLYADFSKEQVLLFVHQKGFRPMFDSQQHCWTKNIVALLKTMWSDVPNERPTSQHVYDVLLKELNDDHHSKI